MTAAKKGDEVIVTYTVRTEDGQVVGGTEPNEQQTLKLGEGNLLPRVDTGLQGMEPGQEKTITVSPTEGFGPHRKELLMEIPRDRLQGVDDPQPGMVLTAKQNDGREMRLVVAKVSDGSVTLDGNHPLAGKTLHFDLKLLEVKQAA